MWQALRTELEPLGVEVVTVALDVDPEAARRFIERAKPEHPALIDTSHLVDELFGIVNVPNISGLFETVATSAQWSLTPQLIATSLMT